MSDTINVNYMTRAYTNYAERYGIKNKGTEKPAESFAGKAEEQQKDRIEGQKTSGAKEALKSENISKEDMTLEEYKQYIHNEISKLYLHPSQFSSSISVHISEEGFKAMQEDPDYEKWVLDTLREDFAFNDPFSGIAGGRYIVHYFGDTKDDYHGHSWYPEYQGGNGKKLYNEKSKGSFWERRAQAAKDEHRQYEKRMDKKARKKKLEKERAQRQLFNRMMEQRAYNSRMRQSGTVQKRMEAATAAYDENIVTVSDSLTDFEDLLF